MSAWPLKYPIVRRLNAHDGTRRKRLLIIKLYPNGTIEIGPRRCKRATCSALGVYIYALQLENGRKAVKKGAHRGRR